MLTLLSAAEGLQTWFFEDRAAHLASCQLPLIVALAGKNNILSCKLSPPNILPVTLNFSQS